MLSHWTLWPMPWPRVLVFPLAGLVIVVVLVVLVFRRGGWMSRCMGGPDRRSEQKDNSPMEILKRRYAAGEISREQFEHMKRDMEE